MLASRICELVIAAVCMACYLNSHSCEFVFDDIPAISDNKDLRPETPLFKLFWNDFWGTPMQKESSHKSYRPLCVLTFRINYYFSKLEPMSYHVVNNLLHATVCVLYYRMSKMFLSDKTSFLAAILFAVHPIHTEAVTGVVGRAELLSSIFYLAALMMYAKCSDKRGKKGWVNLILTVLLVTIAMLCKEQGITVIGICCVYEVFVAQKMTMPQIFEILRQFLSGKPSLPKWLKNAVTRAAFLVCSTVFLLVARVKLMGAQLPVFTSFDNPASVSPAPSRHLTFNYLLPVNGWLLLNPSWLCCDWTMGTIPLIKSFADFRNIATLVFYLILAKFVLFAINGKGKHVRAVIMCLALIALPFIPASNLFFPVGFVVAERILYTPSMGFCMLVALGFEMLLARNIMKKLVWLCMVCLILTHATKTVSRNQDWKSEYSIFKAALRANQNNAKLFNNVGHALENKKSYSEALGYFTRAAAVQPNDMGSHINVGRTLNHLKRFKEAEVSYRIALALIPKAQPGKKLTTRIAPNHLSVFVNLGNLISKDDSRLHEADELYKTVISMRADYVKAYINRGDILMRLNRTQEALDQYRTALTYESDNPDIYYNLGVVNLQLKKHMEAMENFENALSYDPDHLLTLFNSAVLMQEIGDPRYRPEAVKRLKKLLDIGHVDEQVFFNLGMFAMDEKDYQDAEIYFKKAVEIKDDFRSALFNLALLLVNDLLKPFEAEPYLQKLLKYYPTHTKGLILLGDININHKKDVDAAEKNFLKILEYDPKNTQANHNLCVVYVERRELFKAEKCLVYTLSLAPNEDYIKSHLTIVRRNIANAQKRAKEKAETKEKTEGNQP